MACCALEIERLERPNAPFSFVCAPEKAVSDRLTLSRGELVRVIRKQLDEIVHQLLACPTAEIFRDERRKVFGEYSLLTKSLSRTILSDTDPMVHLSLIEDSFVHSGSAISRHAEELFGPEVTGEIMFSLATLRRTYKLVGQILTKDCPDQFAEQDRENAKEFTACVSWCCIHFDCVMGAIKHRHNVRLPLDVLSEILTGLRFAVSAYAHARVGYDSRFPKRAPDLFAQTQWDDEDRYLARLATDDLKQAIR